MEAHSLGNEPAETTHSITTATAAYPVACIQEEKHACLSKHLRLYQARPGFLIGCNLLAANLREPSNAHQR